jgi:transcriptional regulator GlxA family with amidase domain
MQNVTFLGGQSMAVISLWVENGCLSSCVTTMLDAFTIANIWHQNLSGKEEVEPLFDPHIVSTDGKPVIAQGNLRMEAEMAVEEVEQADCVVLSPFFPMSPRFPTTWKGFGNGF